MGTFFDWEKMAEELGISERQTTEIVENARHEFPDDPMMCELHIIRALRSAYEAEKSNAA
jgi:hypothetical protein